MYINECPFCEKIFRTRDLLELHLDTGCPMDSDFSNDSSMDTNVGSDTDEDIGAAKVRFIYICVCVCVLVRVCMCACVRVCVCVMAAIQIATDMAVIHKH